MDESADKKLEAPEHQVKRFSNSCFFKQQPTSSGSLAAHNMFIVFGCGAANQSTGMAMIHYIYRMLKGGWKGGEHVSLVMLDPPPFLL